MPISLVWNFNTSKYQLPTVSSTKNINNHEVTKRSKNKQTNRILNFDVLRYGWVFLEQMWILSGIQFTTHFIEIFMVETKRFVGSFVHVILMRQTCGQRSNKDVESKRQALGTYFSRANLLCFPNTKM